MRLFDDKGSTLTRNSPIDHIDRFERFVHSLFSFFFFYDGPNDHLPSSSFIVRSRRCDSMILSQNTYLDFYWSRRTTIPFYSKRHREGRRLPLSARSRNISKRKSSLNHSPPSPSPYAHNPEECSFFDFFFSTTLPFQRFRF